MSKIVPLRPSVVELLELARRARMHASALTGDEAAKRLLAFAEELEARANSLMSDGSGEDAAPSE